MNIEAITHVVEAKRLLKKAEQKLVSEAADEDGNMTLAAGWVLFILDSAMESLEKATDAERVVPGAPDAAMNPMTFEEYCKKNTPERI